jgi:hypothetical protein
MYQLFAHTIYHQPKCELSFLIANRLTVGSG